MQQQQGFTLIELMIVVAIIGILAAIAIPQYQNYVARSQMSEAVTLASALKSDVTDAYMQLGKTTGLNSGVYGIPAKAGTDSDDAIGKYVQSLVVQNGTITATMKSQNVSTVIQDKSLILTPTEVEDEEGNKTGRLTWKCTSDSAIHKLVPENCRSETTP
ncbi:MAG TPA: pilin [Salinisphaeraceae bacterium]|nr:pilin [Salinisphaeraceae bacterium]